MAGGANTEVGGIQIDFGVQRRSNQLLKGIKIKTGQLGGVVENTTALELAILADSLGLSEIDINAKVIEGNGSRGGGKRKETGVHGELHFE